MQNKFKNQRLKLVELDLIKRKISTINENSNNIRTYFFKEKTNPLREKKNVDSK